MGIALDVAVPVELLCVLADPVSVEADEVEPDWEVLEAVLPDEGV